MRQRSWNVESLNGLGENRLDPPGKPSASGIVPMALGETTAYDRSERMNASSRHHADETPQKGNRMAHRPQRKHPDAMTVQEAGRKGGAMRKQQLGPAGYARMGKKGGAARKEQLGAEGYSELGKKGGEVRKRQLGSDGYAEIGRKGGEARREHLGREGYAELGRKDPPKSEEKEPTPSQPFMPNKRPNDERAA